MLIKLANNAKLGETASILKDKNRIQNYFYKLKQWTEKPKMKFKREKYKNLCVSWINQLYKYRKKIS